MSTKLERKLQDRLNRIDKLIPGLQRVFELENIIERFDADIDFGQPFADERVYQDAKKDILFLRRLAYDLISMRHALKPNLRHNNRFDGDALPRGPRP